MSLRQKVKFELEDGKEIVTEYSAIDLRAWETENGKSSLTAEMSISMLSWLGWHGGVRRGDVDGELKDWQKFDACCESVEALRDERPTKAATAKATQKGRGAASSAR